MKSGLLSGAMLTFLVVVGCATDSEENGAAQQALNDRPPARPKRPHPLAGVASVVEADVVSARYLYDDIQGPRTEFTLANVVVHRGSAPKELTFTQYGGQLPDGSFVGASELPVLNPGSRYVLFLGGTPWFYTPVWAGLSFRVEKVGARSIILGPEGRTVTSFGAEGVTFGSKSIVDYSNHPDPRVPLARTSVTADEVADALDKDGFMASAQAAMDAVGTLAATSTFQPTIPGTKWNITPTVAPTP